MAKEYTVTVRLDKESFNFWKRHAGPKTMQQFVTDAVNTWIRGHTTATGETTLELALRMRAHAEEVDNNTSRNNLIATAERLEALAMVK